MKNELELIFSNDTAYADSRVIARYFGKSHAHVMRDIHNMFLKLGDEVTETNFGFSYKDSTGRTLPCYHLDFDLTVTLITGYDVRLRHKIVMQWHRLIEQRASARNYAKGIRHNFTDTLKEHGYTKQYEYINTTKSMKKPFGITAQKPDMTEPELKEITAAEYLADAMLTIENGYNEVNPICVIASESIKEALSKVSSRKYANLP